MDVRSWHPIVVVIVFVRMWFSVSHLIGSKSRLVYIYCSLSFFSLSVYQKRLKKGDVNCVYFLIIVICWKQVISF